MIHGHGINSDLAVEHHQNSDKLQNGKGLPVAIYAHSTDSDLAVEHQ